MSQIFSFQSVPVRTRIENENIWFVAKDVCAVLGISWSGATMKSIPEQWRTMLSFNIVGKTRRVSCISEPAVYKLAFRSNKPEADAFTNWVASEVLPTIRKTGQYDAAPKAPPKPKQKVLPAPAPERTKLPLPYPFPKEKVDVLLAQINTWMIMIRHAESDITDIMTAEYLHLHPGIRPDMRNRSYSLHSNLSCSTSSLWTSVGFALRAIEDSIHLQLENSL